MADKILVTGASGAVGELVVNELIQRPAIPFAQYARDHVNAWQ